MVDNQHSLCEVATNYFHSLFAATTGQYEPVTCLVEGRVDDLDNEKLLCPFVKDEFDFALSQMYPDKAPGPDDLNAAFFQRYWHVNGDKIFQECCSWLEMGYFPMSLNDTHIALIPKIDNPTSMLDLRPISLCNVLYKLISKVLANRLKGVLQKCVSEVQSSFVEDRSIMDNAIMAMEVIHHKVKNFLWRACRNALPTRERIRDKGVQCSSLCAFCHTEPKSATHIFFTCTVSKGCWLRDNLWNAIGQATDHHSSIKDIFSLCAQLSKPHILNVVMLMWSIWVSRNNSIWENTQEGSAVVVGRAKYSWDEWNMAQQCDHSSGKPEGQQREAKWKRPLANYLAYNVDASFLNHTNATGVGMCLRGKRAISSWPKQSGETFKWR